MTKSQIRAKIAALEAKKAEYEGYKADFEECRNNLTGQENIMKEQALDIIAAPYMICGADFQDWVGRNSGIAMRDRVTIENNMTQYDGEIGALLSEIDEAIRQIEEKIKDLEKEIAHLEEELLTAPDEEPEEQDQNEG